MTENSAAGAPEYVVLLTGDERTWRDADEATRERVFGLHHEFSRLCAERGHTITGGAELADSTTARVVRRRAGAVQVTEGPYAETVEQLGGYYVVATHDVDDLATLVAMLLDEGTGDAAEIRPVVPGTSDGTS